MNKLAQRDTNGHVVLWLVVYSRHQQACMTDVPYNVPIFQSMGNTLHQPIWKLSDHLATTSTSHYMVSCANFTQFYECNSMPNPSVHRCIQTVFEHMITIVVVIKPHLLCPWCEFQIDPMQRLPLKWPKTNHTNLDHELELWIRSICFLALHWTNVVLIRAYLIILSLLSLCALVLSYLKWIMILTVIFWFFQVLKALNSKILT